jgi:hypothetical protein
LACGQSAIAGQEIQGGGANEAAMIIAERVNQYLTRRKPDEVCDSCIADHLKMRHQ